MSDTKEESIAAQARSLYRTGAKKLFPTAFNFSMVALIVFVLGVFYPVTLYLTIPLILLPFFFAFQMSASYLRRGDEIVPQQLLHYVGSYFRMPSFGCYRVIRNALWSWLWAILGGVVVASLGYSILLSVSSDFASAVEQLSSYLYANQLDEATTLINSSSVLQSFYLIMNISEITVFVCSFFHLQSFFGINPYIRLVIRGTSPRIANTIFTGGIKTVRKPFWRDYFSSLWLGDVLFLIGFAGGTVGGYFLFQNDISRGVAFGLGIAMALLLAYIPYYFNVVSLLAEKYRAAFANYSITYAERMLQELQQAQRLSEEEAAALRKSIDESKAAQKENPEYPPLDQETDDDDDSDDNDGGDTPS